MSRLLCIGLSCMLLSPLANADIYKCPAPAAKGSVKYQNFPCEIDSIGSSATAKPPNPKTKAGPNGFGAIDVNDPKALAELREWRLKQRPNHPTGVLFFEQFPDQLDNIEARFGKILESERLQKQSTWVNESVIDTK